MRLRNVVLLALAASSGLYANLIQNGSFESLTLGGTFSTLSTGDTTSLPSWVVTGACGNNCITVLRNGYTENSGTLAFQPEDGLQSLDLTGSFNSLVGGVQQTVASLTAGQRYTLSFWVGNQDNQQFNYSLPSSVQVFVDGVSQGTFTNNDSTPNQLTWRLISLDFTAATTSAVIRFDNATPLVDDEMGLDNVSLEVAAAGGVPEPGTFVLFGLSGAFLALARRKLRK